MKNLKKLYKDCINMKYGIKNRKYTLTHSDETGELFLIIGKKYDYTVINNELRDEVLGSWEKEKNYYLLINLELDTNDDINTTMKRNNIFREHLPLALKGIINGDELFLESNKELYESDIIIKFNSKFEDYNVVENWGNIKD